MASQKAGQKRKVREVPRPVSESSDDELESGNINGAFEDEGESEDDVSDLSDIEEDDMSDDGSLNSDEIPSSESEAGEGGDEDIRRQIRDLTTGKLRKTPPQKLMGSDTAKDVATLSPDTPMRPLDDETPLGQSNYTVEKDANGNDRYVYRDIEAGYDSDDSAAATTNTIGNIPLSYYDEYPHIGYDINGRKITRPAQGQALDSLLDSIDLPEGWTGLTDPSTGKPLQLSREELEVLKKLTRSEVPGEGYDPYPDMIEHFTGKGMEETMPLSGAP